MKFQNGMWMVKEGFNISYPGQFYEVELGKNSIKLFAPFVRVERRGNTLDGGMLTYEFKFVNENAIETKVYHHKGGVVKNPSFDVQKKEINANAYIENGNAYLENGLSKLEIKIEEMEINYYYNNELKTFLKNKATGYLVDNNENKVYMKEAIGLDVSEKVYGFGERFTPFVKNGQSIEIWNEDGGTATDKAYKSIPMYLSSKQYGVFVNHSELVEFEVGTETVGKTQFTVEGESLEYIVFLGADNKQVIAEYTELTGRSPLVPTWSFGLWLSTSFTTNYDEQTVLSFIDQMLENNIPLDVFHFDCFWMREYEWMNFKWDERVFPNPERLLQAIHDRGLKVCVWINPYIGQKSSAFDEAHENGYLVKRKDGSSWQWDKWQAGMGLVDFTNPDARKWYQDKLHGLVKMGVDSFKTDFGERIPVPSEYYQTDSVCYYDGSDPAKMHNYYTYLYNEAVFEVLTDEFGENQACLFARSGTVGSQKLPVHWGGDCLSNYISMAESLRGGLSLACAGFGYWSHDIGGFEAGCTPDIYKRWTQFGLLSSHSRYHGNSEYKVPWLYGDEAVQVTEKFTKLKKQLLPYIYNKAVETTQSGMPILRPMFLEFPEDFVCQTLDLQYMFGDKLLVAPIFNENGIANYWLPAGKWYNILNQKQCDGNQMYTEQFDYFNMPLLIKADTVLEMQTSFDNDYENKIKLLAFDLQSDHTIVINQENKQPYEITVKKDGSVVAPVNVEIEIIK